MNSRQGAHRLGRARVAAPAGAVPVATTPSDPAGEIGALAGFGADASDEEPLLEEVMEDLLEEEGYEP